MAFADRSPVVLFVDDEAGLRTVYSTVLRYEGYTVLEAGSVEEAQQIVEIRDAPLDILLIDVNLPDGWGAIVAQTVTGFYPEVKVIYTTGFAEDDPILDGTLNDAGLVLRKPFDKAALLSVVGEAAERVA
jgi:two-component system, cell cycle sensor histidine kinase and response regulator CckA